MVRITDKSTGKSYSGSSFDEAVDKMDRDRAASNGGGGTASTPSEDSAQDTTAAGGQGGRAQDSSGGPSGSGSYDDQRREDREQEDRDIRDQQSKSSESKEGSPTATSPPPAGMTGAERSARVNEIVEGYRNGSITGSAAVAELTGLGWKLDNARSLLGITAANPEGGGTSLEVDVWKAAQGQYNLSDDNKAQIDWIIKRHLANPKSFTEAEAYAEIAAVLGDDPSRVGQPGYTPVPFSVREDIFTKASAAAKAAGLGGDPSADNSSTASSADSSAPFLSPMFKGFDMSNLPTSELRPLQDAAFDALQKDRNLQGLAPGYAAQLRNRAAASVPLFELGAALGQFGQPEVTNDKITMGGQGVQGLMENASLGQLGGGPTSNSFQNFMQSAQQGLGTAGGQAQAILSGLGITGSESADDAYSGIRSRFINPRLAMLPSGLREIMGAGVGGEIEQLLGGKGSAQINPAEVLQQFRNKGLFF